jgi:ribonuclease HI
MLKIKNDDMLYISYMSQIKVYIDGACINNGKPNAKAGYAVFFGADDPRNEFKQVQGKQSNNTGELTALIRCLQILDNASEHVHIYTDSEYVIKCATTFGAKLYANDWKSKKEIPNLELVKEAYTLFNSAKNTKLHYIEAHTNKDDTHSLGNAEADRLAKLSIGITTNNIKPETIILDWITYDTKDAAKALGAAWNQKKKHWYVDVSISDEVMRELRKLEQHPQKTTAKKTYIKIPYAKKDQAKKLNARWDAAAKSWYYVDGEISEENKQNLLAL